MTVTPIVINIHVTVTKCVFQGLEDLEKRGQVETIQTSIVGISKNSEKSLGD